MATGKTYKKLLLFLLLALSTGNAKLIRGNKLLLRWQDDTELHNKNLQQDCTDQDQGSEVNLNGCSFTEVPAFLNNGTRVIKKLDLGNNNITYFPKWFEKILATVEVLILQNNGLETLPNWMFEHAKNLRVLNLRNNKLSSLNRELLKPLSKLEVLDLSYNQLKKIGWRSFWSQYKTLKTLDLRHNCLTTIDEQFALMINNSTLQNIFLSSNPWACGHVTRIVEMFVIDNLYRINDSAELLCADGTPINANMMVSEKNNGNVNENSMPETQSKGAPTKEINFVEKIIVFLCPATFFFCFWWLCLAF